MGKGPKQKTVFGGSSFVSRQIAALPKKGTMVAACSVAFLRGVSTSRTGRYGPVFSENITKSRRLCCQPAHFAAERDLAPLPRRNQLARGLFAQNRRCQPGCSTQTGCVQLQNLRQARRNHLPDGLFEWVLRSGCQRRVKRGVVASARVG